MTDHAKQYDVVIVGGGAAGLMCAASVAQRGRSVLLVDHSNKLGKKILMSGGGRCNFTNMYVEPGNYLSSNVHFCKSALSRYTQWDFISLVEKYELEYYEKTKGQLFCRHKAKDILNILLDECSAFGVNVQANCSIEYIECIDSEEQRYRLQTTFATVLCRSLVIATGGLSIPTMGATGYGYAVAKKFGMRVNKRQASLVPFVLVKSEQALTQSLAGISCEVKITCGNTAFVDPLLFTHKGLSGPAVLQISNYWDIGDELVIDFLPSRNLKTMLLDWQQSDSKVTLKNALGQYLPKRFIQSWLESDELGSKIDNKPLSEYTINDITRLHDRFHQWAIMPKATEGYRTAEVTRGGVDTNDVSSKTFESKKQPGLYFIGEVLDVTGWLGGYNFQWAWASGWCAAQHM